MLTMIVLTVVSIFMMLIVAGVLPVPCQEDFDFDQRFKTLLGDLSERIETSHDFGGNRTEDAFDIFCWL